MKRSDCFRWYSFGRWYVPAALALCLLSCSRWSKGAPPSPAEYSSRRQLRVWTGGSSIRLHGVHFRNDTLTGVPFTSPPECDSCRVRIPLAAIDSVQVGGTDTKPIVLAFIPFALVALLLLTWHPTEL